MYKWNARAVGVLSKIASTRDNVVGRSRERERNCVCVLKKNPREKVARFLFWYGFSVLLALYVDGEMAFIYTCVIYVGRVYALFLLTIRNLSSILDREIFWFTIYIIYVIFIFLFLLICRNKKHHRWFLKIGICVYTPAATFYQTTRFRHHRARARLVKQYTLIPFFFS